MATSPTPPAFPVDAPADSVVRVTLFSGGVALPPTLQLIALTVTHAVNQLPTARLVLADGDLPGRDFPVSNSSDFAPGAVVQINAGYGEEDATLFEGIVTQHALGLTGCHGAQLVIECRDKALPITLGHRNAHYPQQTDSDVIHQRITAYALDADVDPTAPVNQDLVQYQCSDWDFICARANANGLQVIATGGRVAVKAPATAGAPILQLTYGQNLMAFHAELDLPAQAPQLPSGPTRSRGTLRCQGNAQVVPGCVLAVAGVGQRFSGRVWVASVTHSISAGDWTTDVQFGLPPEQLADQPGVQGLQTGVVQQLSGDPQGEHRVRVAISGMSDQSGNTACVWARLLQVQASNGFGTLFVPELGDDVILGCLHNDPAQPVILGSLYSRSKPPAYALADDNPIQAIVTRCRSTLEFNNQDQRITITTPGRNQVVLSDQDTSIVLRDTSGNQVELTSSGITLSSPQNISLSTQGQINLDAVGAIRITSKTEVQTAGFNISHQAQGSFTAKGNASAELSAVGQTVVQGAMVLIN